MHDRTNIPRTVFITERWAAQGELLDELPDGRAVVLVDGKEITGRLVMPERRQVAIPDSEE